MMEEKVPLPRKRLINKISSLTIFQMIIPPLLMELLKHLLVFVLKIIIILALKLYYQDVVFTLGISTSCCHSSPSINYDTFCVSNIASLKLRANFAHCAY